MHRERQGSDPGELPKPKRLTSVESFGERFTVREGYGVKGDVTAIGKLPGDARRNEDLKGAVGWDGKRRYYVASALAHPVAAEALSTYMVDANCKPEAGSFHAVKFNKSLKPEVIILDATPGDNDIALAKTILRDIGYGGAVELGVV